ncbi:hypothetical protein SAY86_030675 [Trapa natans]|uniref:Uncharacterized protein n=1 Tax=Trapa natans TaxID=22666 RepID=A0AAN7RAU3_TRANT|nr:hypothetical protein SAY86_030675 [Trapa natans]
MGGVPWTAEEDQMLKKCIEQFGEGKWHRVPLLAGLNRCRKSCRLRWLNYLRPNIKRGSFTSEEVELIIKLHKLVGNRWSLIAGRLPGRTANDVKNYWNCHLSKKLSTKQISTVESEENADIGSVQIIQSQPLHLNGVPSLRQPVGIAAGIEEALPYYPKLEPPLPEINTPSQLLGVKDQGEIHDQESKGSTAAENSILLGDLPMEFQLDDEVRVDGFGRGKQRWDWEDLFMDMDLWNSSL